jgi:hypothetical protein
MLIPRTLEERFVAQFTRVTSTKVQLALLVQKYAY